MEAGSVASLFSSSERQLLPNLNNFAALVVLHMGITYGKTFQKQNLVRQGHFLLFSDSQKRLKRIQM